MSIQQTATGERTVARNIQVGDVILPPERELRLWMRRHIQTHNLPECALHLSVKEIRETSDKGGPWIVFKTQYPEAWGHTSSFTFKARPETPWTVITH